MVNAFYRVICSSSHRPESSLKLLFLTHSYSSDLLSLSLHSADCLQLGDLNSEMIRSGKQANFILQSECELKQQLFKFLINLGSPLNLGHSGVARLLAWVLGQCTTTENSQDQGVWVSMPTTIHKIIFSVFQAILLQCCRLQRNASVNLMETIQAEPKHIMLMKDN